MWRMPITALTSFTARISATQPGQPPAAQAKPGTNAPTLPRAS